MGLACRREKSTSTPHTHNKRSTLTFYSSIPSLGSIAQYGDTTSNRIIKEGTGDGGGSGDGGNW